MGRSVYLQSARERVLLSIIGLIVLPGGILLAYLLWRRTQTPQGAIQAVMSSKGVDRQTIRYWTAVSAFETSLPGSGKAWNSRVFKDSKNLFNIIVPGSVKLQYGEGQTIYGSLQDGVRDLFKHVITPYQYPLNYSSLGALVSTMDSHNYFAKGTRVTYLAGCRDWYKRLYGSETL